MNQIEFSSDFKTNGIPIINISLQGRFKIGHNFIMNNGKFANMIGRQQPCYFIIHKSGELNIGHNVGLSCTAISCWNNITIDNNVRIGGGTVIYDTDFHSLDPKERTILPEIKTDIKTAPVHIKENVFIGANCTILKGVTIGVNSIIGASSTVTKSVPENEIWAGNPAKFIRKII